MMSLQKEDGRLLMNYWSQLSAPAPRMGIYAGRTAQRLRDEQVKWTGACVPSEPPTPVLSPSSD